MFDVRRARRNIAFVALGIAFIFLGSLGVQFLISVLATMFAPWLFEMPVFVYGVGSLSMYAVSMPLSLLFFFRCKDVMTPKSREISLWTFAGAFALSFAGSYVFGIIGNIANDIFYSMMGKEPVNSLEEFVYAVPLWLNVLLTVVCAPIFEEIFTRKIVIDRLLPYGEIPAVLISGLAFGLIHGNFNQFFYAAAIGIILGFIYTRTGNIYCTITLHMMFNFLGGVYVSEANKLLGDVETLTTEQLMAGGPQTTGMLMMLAYLALLAICFIGGIITIVKFTEDTHDFVRPDPVPTSWQWTRMLLINPGVWMFFAVCVLMFLM